jgi:hemoglobin
MSLAADTLGSSGAQLRLERILGGTRGALQPRWEDPMSLFDKLGGMPAVNAAVDIFYGKVLADGTLKPFFDGVDMEKQRNKQKVFLAYAFGGPQLYTGEGLRTAHAPAVAKGLGDSHFNAVAGHLQSTLQDLKVPPDLIQEVMTIAASTRTDVLAG